MDATARRIQIACIDVLDEPDNVDSCAALAAALITSASTPGTSGVVTARCLRAACTDLLDEPHSRAAQLHVLELLSIHRAAA